MCHEDITLIPLYARDGSIRAYSLVDSTNAAWINQDRWCLGADERATRTVSGEIVYLHREIMGVEYGDPILVDHINRQHLDNRRSNLRLATKAQNAQNRSKQAAPTSSKYRGVHLKKANPKHRMNRDRWGARIAVKGVAIHVGYFNTEEEAAEAVRLARLKYMTHAID